MKIIMCEDAAFIASADLEQIHDTGIQVEVRDLLGRENARALVLHQIGASRDRVLSVKDGAAVIPSDAFEIDTCHALALICGERRIDAGEISITSAPLLGKCAAPRRTDHRHLWRVCIALSGAIGTIFEKLDYHVNGSEVV